MKDQRRVARVLRILVYTGDPDWVEHSIRQRAVKGRREFGDRGYISDAIVGDIPEMLEYAALEAEAERVLDKAVCSICGNGKFMDRDKCRACGGTGLNNQIRDYDETAAELRVTLSINNS